MPEARYKNHDAAGPVYSKNASNYVFEKYKIELNIQGRINFHPGVINNIVF